MIEVTNAISTNTPKITFSVAENARIYSRICEPRLKRNSLYGWFDTIGKWEGYMRNWNRYGELILDKI